MARVACDGAPGSHVILRTEGRDDPPSETVLDACELAVHFSKFRNARRADVHAVPRKQSRSSRIRLWSRIRDGGCCAHGCELECDFLPRIRNLHTVQERAMQTYREFARKLKYVDEYELARREGFEPPTLRFEA